MGLPWDSETLPWGTDPLYNAQVPSRTHQIWPLLAWSLAVLLLVVAVRQPLERVDTDLLFVARSLADREPPQDPRIVLVYLDAKSMEILNRPTAFWAADYQRVIESLIEAGAVGVGFDFFLNPALGGLPAELRGLLERDFESFGLMVLDHPVVVARLAGPRSRNSHSYESLDTAAELTGRYGFNNVVSDPDGTVRRLGPVLEGDKVQSLAGKLAETVLGKPLVPSELPIEDGFSLRLNFPKSYRTLPLSQVLEGDIPPLEGAVCILGPGPDSNDFHDTSLGIKLGLELHGGVLYAILNRAFIVPLPFLSQLLTWLAVTGLVLFSVTNYDLRGLLGAGLTSLAYFLWAWDIFCRRGTLAPVTSVAVILVLVAGAALVWRYARVLSSRRKLKRIMGRYVSSQVVDSLLRRPELLGFAGESRTISVLFSDITGFTSMSEGLEPAEVMRLLNLHFAEMIAIVDRHGGTVKQFIGDELMILFGAPEPCQDHARRAVATAVAMRTRLLELEKEGVPGFHRIKIGIHTGEVVLGNLGTEERSEYTAVGDTVNVAARIETAAGQMEETVLVSADTVAALGEQSEFRFQSAGVQRFKGRAKEMEVFRVL